VHVDVIAAIIDVNSYIIMVLSCQIFHNFIGFFIFSHLAIERGQVAQCVCVFGVSFKHLIEALFRVYEIIDILISETLIIENWAAIVIIFWLVVACESIAELTIIEEVVSIFL
jgi:hypothetical protein